MRHRHLKLLSLWIVPLLIARAMIPTGFMLSADRGGLELTFCPAGVYQQADGQQSDGHRAAHAGHHAASQQGADEHAGHHTDGADGTACPFSLVAAAVTCDIAPLPVASAAPIDEVFDFISARVGRVGPVRADRIRGPPSYS